MPHMQHIDAQWQQMRGMQCTPRDSTHSTQTQTSLQRRLSQACQSSTGHCRDLLDMQGACQTQRPMDSRPHHAKRHQQSTTASTQVLQQSQRQQCRPNHNPAMTSHAKSCSATFSHRSSNFLAHQRLDPPCAIVAYTTAK